MSGQSFHLRLPASSANLGPGFDTAAIALNLHLDIHAEPAQKFSIVATGRNADICSRVENNLTLDSYANTLRENGKEIQPLHLTIHNEIPLGMGCGSSAAARLAGIVLAVHFGALEWGRDTILNVACMLEGHPDNAVACWLGGMTVATMSGEGAATQVHAVRFPIPPDWVVLIVMPMHPLATSVARAVLPKTYTRQDGLWNVQHVALLVAAFSQGRGDLLRVAMQDFFHQPYRAEMCPMLPKIAPLAGQNGILGVALSGAGPSVLLIVDRAADRASIDDLIRERVKDLGFVEIVESMFTK